MKQTRKIALSGVLIALGVLTGTLLFIPIGVIKAFPVQHAINVLSAVWLGPWYAFSNAFAISFIRNITGTGSLLAFPGSMIGASLAGILYKRHQKISMALIGELIGTGGIGALVATIMAKEILGSNAGFSVIFLSFLASVSAGILVAALLIKSLVKLK